MIKSNKGDTKQYVPKQVHNRAWPEGWGCGLMGGWVEGYSRVGLNGSAFLRRPQIF